MAERTFSVISIGFIKKDLKDFLKKNSKSNITCVCLVVF